ncbi:MAG TPA: hypothetical protein ACHBZ9_06500 [Arsenophonus nasoniae]|uniref:hypothetical protein n=1 Tax=Arsenophonus nasoniae TaxID=638 RepID=UPI0038795C24
MDRPRGRKTHFLVEKKDVIYSMREKGYSYKQIADFIKNEYQITVDATTINRFFLRNEK